MTSGQRQVQELGCSAEGWPRKLCSSILEGWGQESDENGVQSRKGKGSREKAVRLEIQERSLTFRAVILHKLRLHPQGAFGNSWRGPGCHCWGGGSIGIHWVEVTKN